MIKVPLISLLCFFFLLTGCSQARRGLGFDKPIYNDTAVKERPPLKKPQKIALPKPR